MTLPLMLFIKRGLRIKLFFRDEVLLPPQDKILLRRLSTF